MPSLGILLLIARPYLIGFIHMGPTPTRSKTAEVLAIVGEIRLSLYWSFAFFPSARRTGSQIALLAIETPGATRGHRGKWIMS